MGTVRECFLCEMYLTQLERQTAEATISGGNPEVVEVCARCHAKIVVAGAVAIGGNEATVVLRAKFEQRDLFPAASRSVTGGGGRCG